MVGHEIRTAGFESWTSETSDLKIYTKVELLLTRGIVNSLHTYTHKHLKKRHQGLTIFSGTDGDDHQLRNREF